MGIHVPSKYNEAEPWPTGGVPRQVLLALHQRAIQVALNSIPLIRVSVVVRFVARILQPTEVTPAQLFHRCAVLDSVRRPAWVLASASQPVFGLDTGVFIANIAELPSVRDCSSRGMIMP